MAWQRKIPFGYAIQNGTLLCDPVESAAVKQIFTQYLAGSSYSQIACEMERQKIPYHKHSRQWNKNMVKRILENPKYIGADGYPKVIADEDFIAVRLQKQDRTTYAPCPPCVAPIRVKTVCGLCGARMARDTKLKGRARWICKSPECGCRRYIGDEILTEKVQELLIKTAQEPELLEIHQEPKAPSLVCIRLQNELEHELNQRDANPELLKALIFAAAAERYQALDDPTPSFKLHQLRLRVEHEPVDDSILRELLDTAVKSIRIGDDNDITLELMNGKMMSNTKGSA